MQSLIDLCILSIEKSHAENKAEILLSVMNISPVFEKKVYLLNEKMLLATIGEIKKWYKSGELRMHLVKTGDIIKHTSFFKNGQIHQNYTLCNGYKVGKCEEFYATGKLYEEQFYENKTSCKYTRWQSNGYKIKSWAKLTDEIYSEEIYYKNGAIKSLEFGSWKNSMLDKKHGEQFYWDDQGTMTNTEVWEHGHKVIL
ncbi:hypothetical protein PV-S19_0257 [Pacmanvirus S19]|nr:hypothetical protein PV-S19_0257 [Pacmanvirus S19]